MRRRHSRGSDVPADLATYDPARWEVAAEADPRPQVPTYMRAHDAYHDALLAADVDDDEARRLTSAAVVADLKRRLATSGA